MDLTSVLLVCLISRAMKQTSVPLFPPLIIELLAFASVTIFFFFFLLFVCPGGEDFYFIFLVKKDPLGILQILEHLAIRAQPPTIWIRPDADEDLQMETLGFD